jgi:assimilatory nitrate reductase catalytic subunit
MLLSTGPANDEVGLAWGLELLAQQRIDAATRRFILAGRSPGRSESGGPVICACFGVRHAQIEAAVSRGSGSVEAVGLALRAGTNCGSCKPEIRRIVEASPIKLNRAELAEAAH